MNGVQAVAIARSPGDGRYTDPVLGSVLDFGRDNVRVGWTVGLGAAGLLYGYLIFRLLTALLDMQDWVETSRMGLDKYFWSTYEVDTSDAKEKAKEAPKPEAKVEEPQAEEVEPTKTQPVANVQRPAATTQQPTQPTDPYDNAETKSAGGGGEIDHTADGAYEHGSGEGDGVGTGKGKGFGQGEGGGKGTKPVNNPPPGPPPGPPPVDRSAPATLVGSKSWNCPFPPEADAAGKDNATVQLVVTVGANGSAEGVKLIADPGNGFGRAARSCALARKYKSGLDRDGNPTRTSTPPITVRFSR